MESIIIRTTYDAKCLYSPNVGEQLGTMARTGMLGRRTDCALFLRCRAAAWKMTPIDRHKECDNQVGRGSEWHRRFRFLDCKNIAFESTEMIKFKRFCLRQMKQPSFPLSLFLCALSSPKGWSSQSRVCRPARDERRSRKSRLWLDTMIRRSIRKWHPKNVTSSEHGPTSAATVRVRDLKGLDQEPSMLERKQHSNSTPTGAGSMPRKI